MEQRLLSDPGFRERYIRAIDIEAGLYEAFNFPGTFSTTVTRKKSPIEVFLMVAACATVLFGFVGWLFWMSGAPNPNAAASLLPRLKPVAIVTQLHQVAENPASPLEIGMKIRPGLLNVATGQVQFEFFNGAQINVEGPAELHIQSVDKATLISGKVAVRIPPGARGFVLNTPNAAVVDLGTEFAVFVDKQGTSEVHVADGEVAVSLLGNDGNTLKSLRITEGMSVRVNRKPAGLERIDAPSVTLPGLQAQIATPLRVNEDYVRSIRASRPAIYWRFEKLVDGRVPNEISPRWSGTIHAAPDDPSAIVVHDGMARFTPSEKPHRLEPDDTIPGFNHESFTLEFWASLDNFHWASLVAVVPQPTAEIEDAVARNRHMTLIELPYNSSFVCSPGSFRFLYRHPPGNSGGTNLFSDGDCSPGLWHHLVAIKTPGRIKLFLNGKLVRHFAETSACDEDPYRLLVGGLDEGLCDRQLSGAITEFAVYLRALEDEEIKIHYRAMTANRSPN